MLYLSFGTPEPSISEETEDGILIRKHPETGDVVGLTIISFEKRFGARDVAALLPIVLERVHLV